MGNQYRGWRNKLYNLYKKYNNDAERLDNCPEGISEEQWTYCVAYFGSEEFHNDPIKKIKLSPAEVWLRQHSREVEKGNFVWIYPQSKLIGERIQRLLDENAKKGIEMSNKDIYDHVLQQSSNHGVGNGSKHPLLSELVNQQMRIRELEQKLQSLEKEKSEILAEREKYGEEVLNNIRLQYEKENDNSWKDNFTNLE
ncbi:hypothetical protein SLE2022_356310 [Rubroshorea leprosula]